MREVFQLGKEQTKVGNSFTVSAYMMELYNDQLVDLLNNDKGKRPDLKIKKDAKGMVFVQGAVQLEATDPASLQGIMDVGMSRRHTSATQMNDVSSRSHLIFAMIVETVVKGSKNKVIGKISLVDLAGSERVKKTGASAERLLEAQSINKSLSALGDVIAALSSGESFIPYRNNKLTLLMSDSLGGNAKTLMFVCFSPADYNTDETAMALTYASRVKLIKNDATKNVETKEVQKLKKIINELRAGNKAAGEEEDDVDLEVDQRAFEEQLLSVHDMDLANKTKGEAVEQHEEKERKKKAKKKAKEDTEAEGN
jgi:kinesin family protein C2/C3